MKDFLCASTPETWSGLAVNEAPDYAIADCGSGISHERRLRALLTLPIRANDQVVDFGCGTGAFSDMLAPDVKYLGIDWSSDIIRLARKRRPSRDFMIGNISQVPNADWIVASGPFNYASGWSKGMTAAALGVMSEKARLGMGITVLRVPTEGRLHYTITEVLQYFECRSWDHIHCDQSYLPNDMCVTSWNTR